MSSKQKQKGFTLIELVVVIAILAILAAFALPRFAQLSEQAHESSIQATAGALSAAVALVKAQSVTNGDSGADTDGVEGFGDGTVITNAAGWPGPVENGGCTALWGKLLQANAPTVIGAGATAEDDDDYQAAIEGDTCTYTYLQDGLGSEIVYDSAEGAVTTTIN